MNNLKLKAMRQSLGLTVAEACTITKSPKTGEPPSKRYFQYLEAGKYKVPDNIELDFFSLSSYYALLLEKLSSDIEKFKKANPKPVTDDPDEYFEKLKSVKKLVLPFFKDHADFQKVAENQSVSYWRIWQAVVGHLALIGKINYLDDTATIPDDFESLKVIKGYYDPFYLDKLDEFDEFEESEFE